jgi:hypothetical protein
MARSRCIASTARSASVGPAAEGAGGGAAEAAGGGGGGGAPPCIGWGGGALPLVAGALLDL